MLELTDSARKELEAYFENKEKATIRIYAANGCCGARLALALDDATPDDHTEEKGGFTFCMNKELLSQVQGVTVNMGYMGFMIDPLVPLPAVEGGGCAACGGGCGGDD
ncbi:MAG: IscA/HesB family protein [Desulfovibrio sp.]|jgi:Fe-S cluster assembly iron-binding protein IscA|nr:IscA/HesB family protein [Desulfovibrio sp.]